jgi:hypothetical protein
VIRGTLVTALLLVALSASRADAILVTPGNDLQVDFTLPQQPPFSLPAVLLDQTVEFSLDNPLDIGEAYQVQTFDHFGTLLQTSSYTDTLLPNVIGCACTGGPLDPFLTTPSGFLLISALAGSFDVTDVFIVARDGTPSDSADGDNVDAITHLRNVPEPATLELLGLGLAGIGFTRRKHAA